MDLTTNPPKAFRIGKRPQAPENQPAIEELRDDGGHPGEMPARGVALLRSTLLLG
jgi:hypothetical protein